MTPDQIAAMKPADLSTNAWLKEVAWQLAKMNEPKKAGRPPKEKHV